jgi:hypothetical protein
MESNQRYTELVTSMGLKPSQKLLAFYERAHADGCRAMYDSIAYRAANNWHGRKSVNAIMQEENRIALEWARDALHEVDPEDYAEWVSIKTSYRQGADDERIRQLTLERERPAGLFGIRRWIRNHV